jgi:hypothetical protein
MQTAELDTPLRLSRDEIVAQLECGAQRRVHMSAADLVRTYREGRLPDPGRVADLLMLAHLLDERDPLFVSL